jgi:hypothetical protein
MVRVIKLKVALILLMALFLPATAKESIPELVRRIKPAVVTVIVYDDKAKVSGSGSGFFVGPDRVITNQHVVEGAYRAEVKTINGKVYPVRGLIAVDGQADIVLLQIDVPAKIMNSAPALSPSSVVTPPPPTSAIPLSQSRHEGLVHLLILRKSRRQVEVALINGSSHPIYVFHDPSRDRKGLVHVIYELQRRDGARTSFGRVGGTPDLVLDTLAPIEAGHRVVFKVTTNLSTASIQVSGRISPTRSLAE